MLKQRKPFIYYYVHFNFIRCSKTTHFPSFLPFFKVPKGGEQTWSRIHLFSLTTTEL
jgi:hypothetical protein